MAAASQFDFSAVYRTSNGMRAAHALRAVNCLFVLYVNYRNLYIGRLEYGESNATGH